MATPKAASRPAGGAAGDGGAVGSPGAGTAKPTAQKTTIAPTLSRVSPFWVQAPWRTPR